jgi:hypothetical protein
MKTGDVLTNEFLIRYDMSTERLLIYRLKNGKPESDVPISLRLSTLKEMGKDPASKWVGETLLLLIPSVREKLFDLPKEPTSARE